MTVPSAPTGITVTFISLLSLLFYPFESFSHQRMWSKRLNPTRIILQNNPYKIIERLRLSYGLYATVDKLTRGKTKIFTFVKEEINLLHNSS